MLLWHVLEIAWGWSLTIPGGEDEDISLHSFGVHCMCISGGRTGAGRPSRLLPEDAHAHAILFDGLCRTPAPRVAGPPLHLAHAIS